MNRLSAETRGSSGGSIRKGDGIRLLRVEKELLLLLSKYVMSSFRGELPGLLCLNRVKVSADLRLARVYFSVINGMESDDALAQNWLTARAVDMQAVVGQKMRMRYTPKLSFEPDRSLEKALVIDQLLHQISVGKNPTS